MRIRTLLSIGCLFALGCSTSEEDRAESLTGYLVFGEEGVELGFREGDTLQEISLDRVDPQGRQTVLRVTDSLQLPSGCVRSYGDSTRYVIYMPAVCGRNPILDKDWTKMPHVLVLHKGGREVVNAEGYLSPSVECPGERDESGRPYGLERYPPDGCWRSPPIGNWRMTSAGIRTPKGVILPDPIYRGMLSQCTRAMPTEIDGQWLPTLNDIALLEAEFPNYWKRHQRTTKDLDLNQYVRQYGGLSRDGARIIYVNAFYRGYLLANEGLDSWIRVPVNVCDGGVGFFGVEFDVDRKRFENLNFNGDA
jgi:hypothetical protein